MAKSKYPQELDTSVEIPSVRDNITEIGSDVINSIRDAIFKIERTLGINPQGATGNTVATRLSGVIDENGNILSDALSQANVLSGPIIDADVSRVASIRESKLKLDFPTTLLQNEISIINSELENIVSSLEEISVKLSIHLNPAALNRHSGVSISIASADVIASDIASLSLAAGTLQDIIETLYSSHVNYTGTNISSTNNSHLSSQIFFNNENTSDIIFSGSVQGAIEDLAAIESVGFRNALLNLHSNGRVRSGSITDGFEGNLTGTVLLASTSVSFTQTGGLSRSIFNLDTASSLSEEILEYDVLTLSGSTIDEDNRDYQISSITLNGSDELISVEIYGNIASDSTSSLIISISKNTYVSYNEVGFSSVVRPRSNKTNTPDIQIANPDSATIISVGIRAESITADAHTFDISIDGGTPITIDTYNATLLKQNLNSVISKINDQFVDQHLNAIAYKSRGRGCFEMAISHNVPNFSGDTTNRTIQISLGSANDGTSTLGLSSVLDFEIEGSSGNSLNLNGLLLNSFGLIKQFSDATIAIVPGTLTLSLFSGSFFGEGVRVGDLVVIDGSDDPTDDGSYRVESINGDVVNLDLAGSSFNGALSVGAQVLFIRASAPIGELTFTEIASVDGTILFDVFMTENKDIHYTKRLEVDGSLSNGSFTGTVSDVSRNFILSGQTSTLNVDTAGLATLTGPDLLTGAAVFVGATGRYEIFAADQLSFITIEVNSLGPPIIAQQVTIYGFDEIGKNNYHLSRGGFSTILGRVLGESSDPGVPVMVDKRNSGTADVTIIGESFIERYIEGPRNELRGSGVIRGCEVSNPIIDTVGATFQTFDVSAGIIVVGGIRYEFPGLEQFRIDTGDTYYVAFDRFGCIIAEPITADPVSGEPVSPFFDQEIATLSVVINDGVIASNTDLRLFVDNLDYKLISDITVSQDQRFGHFTDIKKAVDYARRFSEMFPNIKRKPSVTIKEGSHQVSEQILVDFDLTIRGVGRNTRIVKSGTFAEGTVLTSFDNIDIGTAVFLIGGGQNSNAADINRGVTISDLVYNTASSTLSGVGCFLALTQDISLANNNHFIFENINMIGPSSIDGASAEPDKIGEYFLIVGKQDPTLLTPTAGTIMGNFTVNNCYFRMVGLELGAIKILESSGGNLRNVIVTQNIATSASPSLDSGVNIIIEYPDPINVDAVQIIESSNIRRNTGI
jgi:hypothetical protein